MKKVGVLVVVLLLFTCVLVSAEGESSGRVGKYVEIAGENLLKFQEFFMGALAFLSFGAFGEGGTLAFAQFLFMMLVFMMIYAIVDILPILSSKFSFPFALAFTILAFLFIDVSEVQVLLITYESMGVVITVVLPVLILLAFTFRMYQRAYEGESEKSPFYAKLFNLIFLIFFGIFFIRHSKSEEGAIAVMRLVSGWILIGLGIAQFVLYKIAVNALRLGKDKLIEARKQMRKDKQKAADQKAAFEEKISKI